MTGRRTISATNAKDSGRTRKATEPSPGHIKYLQSRVEGAHRAFLVAKEQRLGATVIKRREGKWRLAVARLAAETPARRAA